MFVMVNYSSKLYVVFIFCFGLLCVFYNLFKVFTKDIDCHHNQKKRKHFDI